MQQTIKAFGNIKHIEIAEQRDIAVVATDQNWLGIIDLESGKVQQHWERDQLSSAHFAVSPSGQSLAISITETAGGMFSSGTTRLLHANYKHPGKTRTVAIVDGVVNKLNFGESEDECWIQRSDKKSNVVEQWKLSTRSKVSEFDLRGIKKVHQVAFSNRSQMVAVAEAKGLTNSASVTIWNLKTGEEHSELHAKGLMGRNVNACPMAPHSMMFSRKGTSLMAATGKVVKNTNAQAAAMGGMMHGFAGALAGGVMQKMGEDAATNKQNSFTTLRIWNLSSGELRQQIPNLARQFQQSISKVSLSPCGRYALAVGGDDVVQYWDLKKQYRLGLVYRCTESESERVEERRFASGEVNSILDAKSSIVHLAFTRDGNNAIVGLDHSPTLRVISLNDIIMSQ